MTDSSTSASPASIPEQRHVDAAYARVDELRKKYRDQQARTHAIHGVGNPQAWTEREALSAHLGDMAARLEAVEDRLVFGRLDMADGDHHHIGRVALSTTDGEHLLIDWRAPVAMPFYQATAIDPKGVVRRRHITTHGRTVVALEDELLDSSRAEGMDLQGEGALMSALDKARDGRMGDIVATIQSEQDAIIRAPRDGAIVVQGGPGTGKTAVALHRIAYLLYAERERLERSGVLLVGPSRIFLRYIEQVLPSLGETGVVSTTIGDLLPGVDARGTEPLDVAQAKGHIGWAQLLKQAVKMLPRELSAPTKLQVWSRTVTLTPDDVSKAIRHARHTRRTHNQAREGFALELMEVLAERLASDASSAGGVLASNEDKAEWISEIRDSIDARRAINLAWMPTSAKTLLRRLYARPQLLAHINDRAGRPVSPRLLPLVERHSAEWTDADIPLLDELEELLGPMPTSRIESSESESAAIERARAAIEGQGLGGGIVNAEQLAESTLSQRMWTPLAEQAANDRKWAYGHIVVDEAQDLSPMAWRSLLRRCPSRSFTIVGDLDQRRGSKRPKTWVEALGPASRAYSDEFVLTVSYRTPATLTAIAEAVMARAGKPVIHPMSAVRDVEDCYRVVTVEADTDMVAREDSPAWAAAIQAASQACERLDATSGEGSGRVAILVSDSRGHAWNADSTGESALDSRITLLSASSSKGLEFDTVIVVEPGEIFAEGVGDLFVALTRATHDLVAITSSDLPKGMDQW